MISQDCRLAISYFWGLLSGLVIATIELLNKMVSLKFSLDRFLGLFYIYPKYPNQPLGGEIWSIRYSQLEKPICLYSILEKIATPKASECSAAETEITRLGCAVGGTSLPSGG